MSRWGTVGIERGGRKMRLPVIESARRDMTRADYTLHALWSAGAWGEAVKFWVKDGDSKQASRLARLAARWALKVTGREVAK